MVAEVNALSTVAARSDAPAAAPAFARPATIAYRERLAYHRARRGFDAVVAALALTIFSPLLAVAALAILIEDGSPVLFAQRRVGRFERLFTIYKLRTMRANVGDGYKPVDGRDPRITRTGYWLRKLSIDEIPQLWNVIRGDMALVGPRPEMPFIVRRYEAWQHARHLVLPGITGLWQIRCRSTVPLHLPQATAHDIEYINAASHVLDGSILVRTFRAVFSTEGAC